MDQVSITNDHATPSDSPRHSLSPSRGDSTPTLPTARTRDVAMSELEDFFTDDDGQILYEDSNNAPLAPHPTPWTAPPIPAINDTASLSVHSVITLGVLHLRLDEFCEKVTQHRSLRRAQIVSADCYTERNGGILHRFLVLELHRDMKKAIYLRLDRRVGASTLQLLLARGTAPAKDSAQLSADKERLIGQGQRESRQAFSTVPTLMELQHFLRAICRELATYTVWPQNCYFFCSLIQEHLGAESDGQFVQGSFQHLDLAPERRQRVKEEVRLFYHMPKPFSLSELLRSYTYEGILTTSSATLNLAQRVGTPAKITSDSDITNARKLQKALRRIIARFDQQGKTSEVRDLSKERLEISRQLYQLDNGAYCADLWKRLILYAHSLKAAGSVDQPCAVGSDAVTLMRYLYERYPKKYRLELTVTISACVAFYWEANRYTEALALGAEDVDLGRRVYSQHPNQYREFFILSLQRYGVCLGAANRYGEACTILAEAVALCRDLFTRAPEQYRGRLCEALREYSASLHHVQRFEEAGVAGAEEVHHYRLLFESDPEKHWEMWGMTMRRYEIFRREASRFDEACAVGAEDVAHARGLSERDPHRHRWTLFISCFHYGISLHDASRFQDACAAFEEALVPMRRVFDEDKMLYGQDLMECLSHYGDSLRSAGRSKEADVARAEMANFGPYRFGTPSQASPH